VRPELQGKYTELKQLLADAGGVLVAFSGGVDSTLVLRAAVEAVGERALGVTATSVIHPRFEIEEAKCLAGEIGARHRVVEVDPLSLSGVAHNPPDRCYHCKHAVFSGLLEIAREEGLSIVADGTNVDDHGDFRPGLQALRELGIRSPLRGAGLGKAEIREISEELGLPTWNKPAYACLATRIPYGEELTPARLRRIDAAEDVLRRMGFAQIRVRDHGEIARIEIAADDFGLALEPQNRARIVRELQDLGYSFVALDLEGYRTGSMNVGLSPDETQTEAGESSL
jgi:uncharacterized protein